jgi:hypothetical protein
MLLNFHQDAYTLPSINALFNKQYIPQKEMKSYHIREGLDHNHKTLK